MFSRFFKTMSKRRDGLSAMPEADDEPCMEEIDEESPDEALLAHGQAGGQAFLGAMKLEKDMHMPSLLCALGALAGYACQAAVRQRAIEQGLPENGLFTVLTSENDQRYFFGPALHRALIESPHSILQIASDAARRAGATAGPDVNDILSRTLEQIGSERFGALSVPDEHQPMDTPLGYLEKLWPEALAFVRQFCGTSDMWPIVFGCALHEAIRASQDSIDPGMALQIVLESAIPMSRITLDGS